jgi:hypothetical protein
MATIGAMAEGRGGEGMRSATVAARSRGSGKCQR